MSSNHDTSKNRCVRTAHKDEIDLTSFFEAFADTWWVSLWCRPAWSFIIDLFPRSGTESWEERPNSISQRGGYSRRFQLSQREKLVASAGQ